MEDYKEKYEEAKEIMLEFVRRGSITMDFAKVIFPELGESDDDIEKSKNLDFLPPDGKPKQLNLERLVCDFLSFYPDEETKRRYMELGRYNQKQNIAINYIRDALKHAVRQQGMEYKDGRLWPIERKDPAATEKEPSVQQPAMIKASELMLGAWLRHAGTGELMQVTRIDAIRGGGHFACGSPHCWEYNNRFEPVPLTAEILEKNGFEYHSGERGMYGVTTANYYAIEGSPHIFCDGDPFAVWFEDEVPIRYVHELQLVLRLCGIEKDIEL